MANEFIIKNGFRSQGNSQVTGSLEVSAGITGSLQGTATTASYALNAVSASQAVSSSFATTSSKSTIQILTGADTRSFALTMVESNTSTTTNNPAPIAIHTGTPLTYTVASGIGTLNTTASFATSASFTANAASASYATIASDAYGISSSITNNTNNNILTATGTGVINGESNLTFDSTVLTLTNGILTFTGSNAGIGRIQQSPGGGANGLFSHAQGLAVSANGDYSHAEGSSTNASGFGSHAEGSGSFTSTSRLYGAKNNTITSGVFQLPDLFGDVTADFAPGNRLYYNSAAYPDNTSFVVNTSVFGGVNTTITLTNTGITDSNFVVGSLDYSFTSWGGNQPSSADGGHAEGYYTTAVADWSHAEGFQTQTFARFSHAEGLATQANGIYSHAEGRNAKTFGSYSHAEGEQTQAKGDGSHAEGFQTIASGSYSHAEGRGTKSTGDYSHAEGRDTQATGQYSHAEGYLTISSGSYSHAEGASTTANGYASHAEGQSTGATGLGSHAEGNSTTATGVASHAEGESTTANGQASHAEGTNTISSGQASHAEGNSTKANGYASHAEGSKTTTGDTSGYYTEMTASGVFTISSSYGDVSTAGLFNDGYIIGVDDSQYNNTYTYANLIVTSCSFDGTNTIVHVTDTTFYTSKAIIGSISNFGNGGDRAWGGYAAHAQGVNTLAQGVYSHAEGQSTAYGTYSHAEGQSTAFGAFSHAEGASTTYGNYSHAEGQSTAYGTYSHAEGTGVSGWIGYRISASIALGVIKLEPIYGDRTPDFAADGFVLIRDADGDIVAGVPNTYRYQISSSAFTSSLTQITLYDTSVTTATTKPTIGIYGNPNPHASDVECGLYSHAAGVDTATLGDYSDAAGHTTRTLGWYQSVVGQFNQPISQSSAFIVGDGVDDATRHNLLVAASGSVVISGSLILTPTASGAPTSPGTDGQIIFGQAGGNYKIYVWLGGAWRSGSLS